MNSLSLIILFLGLLANLTSISQLLLGIGFIGAGITTFILMYQAEDTSEYMKGIIKDSIYNNKKIDLEEAKKIIDEIKDHRLLPIYINSRNWFLSFVVIGFILSFISIDQKYIVMIAASQVGELALNTETAKTISGQLGGISSDATILLQTYIKSETKKLQEDIIKSEPKAN